MAEAEPSADAATSWLAKADDDLAVARLVLDSSNLGRYPEDIASPSAETARRAVEAAQIVLDHVWAALAAT